MKKLFLSCLLSVLCTLTAFSADYSGTCGANLTWSFEPSKGVLTISGTGAMDDFNYNTSDESARIFAPWFNATIRSNTTEINIEQGVTTIGDCAFWGFDKTSKVTISNSITSIGQYAFYQTSLQNLKLGENVTAVGYMAFMYNQQLTSITLNSKLMDISSYAFCYCNKLTEVIIPDNVKSIGFSCFRNCSELSKVEIGDGVTDLGGSAFALCKNLQSVKLGNNVQTLKELVFEECTSIESIEIPNSVQLIKTTAFEECSGLKKVHIGSGIKEIEKSAFYECYNFKELTIEAVKPPTLDYSFWQTGLEIVYVPCNSVEAYNQAKEWRTYTISSIEDDCGSETTQYTVSVASDNTTMGTVSGGGTYEEGATATVTATPKSGYKFTRWSNGSTANPYSFIVTNDVSLTAYFEQSSTPQPESSTFWNMSDAVFNSLGTISSNKTINGLTIYATSSKNVVIDGSNQEIDGLSFTHRLKLNGTGSSDARLLSFQVDGKCDIDVYLKSGSGSEDRTINVDKGSFGSSLTTIPALSTSISKGTIHYTGGTTTIYLYSPSGGVNIYAIRVTSESTPQPTTYTVSVSSANTSMGTVSGGGTYEEGATATVIATPKSGYKFTKWSDNTTKNPYSFTVSKNVTLKAYFEQDNTTPSGSITCEQAAQIAAGLSHNTPTTETYTVVGYVTETDGVISKGQQIFWMADTKNGGKVFECYWGNVSEAMQVDDKVSVKGKIMRYNSTYEIKNGDVTLLERGSSIQTFTVSVSSANTSMGTVSGGGTFEEGATATVTATPKSGYKFTKWSDNTTKTPYTFTVTKNVTLIAYFETDGSSTSDEITCEQAAQIAASLEHNTPTSETYTVVGYVTETDGVLSRGQQIFWMADTQNGGKVFESYWGNVSEVMQVGDKVSVTGKIMRYNSTYEIKNGDVILLSRETDVAQTTTDIFINKILRNGQLLILHGDKTYTVQGQEVR